MSFKCLIEKPIICCTKNEIPSDDMTAAS